MEQLKENEIVVLYCGRAVKPEARLSEVTRRSGDWYLRHVTLACGNKVEALDLLKLIQDGAAGVLVVCCPFEECQFTTGSKHAFGRVSHARQLLTEIGLEPDRIKFVPRFNLTAAEVSELVSNYQETLRALAGAAA